MASSSATSLGVMESKLPPGFRFHPRDEELVCYYLASKISGYRDDSTCPMIVDVDLNNCEPWDLPEMACVGGKEWYFFSLRDRKYATGQRTNRATQSGYWKATGKDKRVTRKGMLVGLRKTLVFYQGRAPKGKKTEWVMHEFRAEESDDPSGLSQREDWVLCRVFYKSRETVAKLNSETVNDDQTGLSSLPALMDTYINFAQAPGYEQVSCFSNFRTDSAPTTSALAQAKSSTNMDCLTEFGVCDKGTVSIVLDHLARLEGNAQNDLATSIIQGSVENIGVPQMWSYY